MDVALALDVVTQRAAQVRYDLADVVFFHHQARPKRLHQGVLVDQIAGVLHKQQQGAEHPRRQVDFSAIAIEHPLL